MSKLDEAIAVIKAGDIEQGRRLLIEVLQEEPQNAQAWLWMSGVVSDPERRHQSLLAVLEIDPDNELAKKGLAKFGWAEEEIEVVTEPEPIVTAVDETLAEPEPWEETVGADEASAAEATLSEPDLLAETRKVSEVSAAEATLPEPDLLVEAPDVVEVSAAEVVPLPPEPQQPALRWGLVVVISVLLLILFAVAVVVILMLI